MISYDFWYNIRKMIHGKFSCYSFIFNILAM